MQDLEEIRKLISLYAKRKELRLVPNSRDMPCVWTPWQVENPSSGIVFSPEAAWRFIADLADSGHPIEEMILDKPKGEKAYVMKVKLETGNSELYIKVQVKNNRIFGRSFHYSTQ